MARLPYLVPYDPDFLGDGFRVPTPTPRCAGNLVEDGVAFDYIHASLVMHRDRRSAIFAAHNVDISQRRSVPRTSWELDNRLPASAQTGPGAYVDNPWDRGHLVRRAAVAWGSTQRAQDASDATFFYTNASPQHERFNQDEWVFLEDWVLDTAGDASSRLCVFTGPLYTARDQFHNDTRIPSAFWKIVVLRDPADAGDDLAVLGFVMKQNELWDDWNGADLLDLRVYQVGLKEIGLYTGLEFGGLALLDEFEWRQVRFRDRARLPPILIEGPDDIDLRGTRRRRERGVRALRFAGPDAAEAPAGPGDVDARRASDDCGCDKASASVQDRVGELGRQVTALRDLVEGLLEEDDERDADRAAELHDNARATFARIVGGQMVTYGEFPDCACIGLDEREIDEGEDETPLFDADTAWFCSGVLISDRVVLTAAHCAPSINRAFLEGRSLSYLGLDGEVARVESVIVHPDYHPNLVPSHDVAVLVLASEAETDPAAVAGTDEVAAQEDVMLVGFGYDHPTYNIGFGTKRKVSVRMTNTTGDPAELVQALEDTHGFDSSYELHAGIKGLGKDSCNGDSGGPAYVLVDDEWAVAAITSRAAFSSEERCGDGGVYTRIAPYLEWIHSATGGLAGTEGDEQPPPPTSSALYVSAAQPNPAGPDVGNEWVEVTNGGATPVVLDAYAIGDEQGGREELQGAVTAGGTYRVTLPEGSAVRLANDRDGIILYRGDDEMHRVGYERAGKGEVIRFEAPDPGDGGPIPDPCHGPDQPSDEPLPIDADPC